VEEKPEETEKTSMGARLMDSAIKFTANQFGNPPLSAVSTAALFYNIYKSDKIEWKDPHEAYLALTDAVYRPRVTLTTTQWEDERFRVCDNLGRPSKQKMHDVFNLKVSLPFFIPNKSVLYVRTSDQKPSPMWLLDKTAIKPVQVTSHSGPNEYIKEKKVVAEKEEFFAMVQLDLYGDTKVVLPYEPKFCKKEIATQMEKNTIKGVQSLTEAKWIQAESNGKIRNVYPINLTHYRPIG
jgi:hypothetical protein